MSDPSFSLQTALYTALDGALSCSVYDHVPQDSSYPYVVIDYEDVSDADFLNTRKDARLIYLSVWSQYAGQKEVKDIISTIDTTLHRKQLSLSSGRAVTVRVLSKRTNREPDGVTFMGQVGLQILTEH